MSKTLIIVESPSKGRKIEKYLGKDYIVRASYGHICDLSNSGKNRLGVDIEDDFKPNYIISQDKKDKIKAILDAAKDVDQIFLASDPDREGEQISKNLFDILKTNNAKKLIKRVHFYEITKEGVKKGIQNLLDINQDVIDAQQARRVLDRIVGYMVSPFLIKAFGPNMSAGRVQSVAVRLVVDRERQIEDFVPEEYWPISATLTGPNSKESFVARLQDKINNKIDAEKIKKQLESSTFQVTEVLAEEKFKPSPAPLITSTLQQVAARKFGIAAAKTMRCAQTLYESGLVTYIRTDSTRCSPESIQQVRDYIMESGQDVPSKPNEFKNKDQAQNAHEAIRPTDIGKKASELMITDEEKKIYSLIWNYFVASQMKPALFDTVQVTIQSSSGSILKANGKTLKYRGWQEILKENDKEDQDSKLPLLVNKDKLALVPPGIVTEQKFSQPPVRYKEHSLIKELEKRGIGRPATYAQTMNKLTERAYVEKRKDTFYATLIGKKVVDTLVKYFNFMEYQYTADMELQLDLIENGKLTYLAMMNSFYPPFVEQLEKAIQSNEKDYGIVCEDCSKSMRLKIGKFGQYMACPNYPDSCKNTFSCNLVDGKIIRKIVNKQINNSFVESQNIK